MYPTNEKNLKELIGKVIEFNDEVEYTEIDFDSKMRAKVISAEMTDEDVFKLELDFSEYEEYNKEHMKSNYWDKNHQPTLKWCETRYYPTDCKCHEYFGFTGEGNNCFSVIS
jgi:hypothetical protein